MKLVDLIARAFSEAMPRGDLTSRHLKLESTAGGAKLFAREDLVFAGRETFETALRPFAPNAEYGWQFDDGAHVLAGQNICWIKAPPNALLAVEPVALDLLGRACGIATLTAKYVREMKNTNGRVICARQGTPGLRDLEYTAVEAGGGAVPSGNLSETLFISRNHALAAGSLARAIDEVRRNFEGDVAVECDSLDDVRDAVARNVARIAITTSVEAAAARPLIPRRIPFEAGEVPTLAEARALAAKDVDFVRVEQLTTTAPRARLGLSLPLPPPRSSR